MSLEKYCINAMITRVMSSKQATKTLRAVPGINFVPNLWSSEGDSHRVTAVLIDTSGNGDPLCCQCTSSDVKKAASLAAVAMGVGTRIGTSPSWAVDPGAWASFLGDFMVYIMDLGALLS